MEPIVASDAEIEHALAQAELPPLLAALAYVTGDLSLFRDELRPDPMLLALPQGGLNQEQQVAVRGLALATLTRFRDDGARPAPPPSEADLARIMEFVVGGTDMSEYVPLLEEELALLGEDRRGPSWHRRDVAPDTEFRVVIIGAGMSGLLAAQRLRAAGVDFVVLEKNDDVGGTWYENSYPGCRVDNPNHNYSYSFAQRHDWPFHFSSQDVLLDYFRRCADDFGVRDRIQFGTEVLSATWSDPDGHWTILVRDADGAESSIEANAVISAVGQLEPPLVPADQGARVRSRARRSIRRGGTTRSTCAASGWP